MAKQYYDRYENFRYNNEVKPLPFLPIKTLPTDIYIEYNGRSRLDIVSQTYYGAPYYGWLILQANPQFGGLEFDIPVGTTIRVPFPLNIALQSYQESVTSYNILYNK